MYIYIYIYIYICSETKSRCTHCFQGVATDLFSLVNTCKVPSTDHNRTLPHSIQFISY